MKELAPTEADLAARLRAAGCVFAEDEARLLLAEGSPPDELARRVERRVAGEPLEHILGWATFCGLRICLEAGVFIPRQRSEFLVRQAAAVATDGGVTVDLCCGSGALGLALTSMLGQRELHAADIDPAAVRCARRNLAPVGAQVYEGDLFEPLPSRLRGQVDVLLANVPYVPTRALPGMPAEARDHEPVRTHDGGDDGLDVLRRLLAEAPGWLSPGGWLLTEINDRQSAAARRTFAAAGLQARIVESPDDYATVAIGTLPRKTSTSPDGSSQRQVQP